MKTKKYLLMALVSVALLTGALWAANGPQRIWPLGQWEYANYRVATIHRISQSYLWSSPAGYLLEIYQQDNPLENSKNFWRKAGLVFGSETAFTSDWFNALGLQGWELVAVNVTDTTTEYTTDYWFKRPRPQPDRVEKGPVIWMNR